METLRYTMWSYLEEREREAGYASRVKEGVRLGSPSVSLGWACLRNPGCRGRCRSAPSLYGSAQSGTAPMCDIRC
eukprot:3072455-Pyramimonas_sp.AAC.1